MRAALAVAAILTVATPALAQERPPASANVPLVIDSSRAPHTVVLSNPGVVYGPIDAAERVPGGCVTPCVYSLRPGTFWLRATDAHGGRRVMRIHLGPNGTRVDLGARSRARRSWAAAVAITGGFSVPAGAGLLFASWLSSTCARAPGSTCHPIDSEALKWASGAMMVGGAIAVMVATALAQDRGPTYERVPGGEVRWEFSVGPTAGGAAAAVGVRY